MGMLRSCRVAPEFITGRTGAQPPQTLSISLHLRPTPTPSTCASMYHHHTTPLTIRLPSTRPSSSVPSATTPPTNEYDDDDEEGETEENLTMPIGTRAEVSLGMRTKAIPVDSHRRKSCSVSTNLSVRKANLSGTQIPTVSTCVGAQCKCLTTRPPPLRVLS